MIRAFHGDPAIRSDVIARLERHADAGTLSFGASHWDGTSGTPLGVAAESAATEDYAARFGYPLALAGCSTRSLQAFLPPPATPRLRGTAA